MGARSHGQWKVWGFSKILDFSQPKSDLFLHFDALIDDSCLMKHIGFFGAEPGGALRPFSIGGNWQLLAPQPRRVAPPSSASYDVTATR